MCYVVQSIRVRTIFKQKGPSCKNKEPYMNWTSNTFQGNCKSFDLNHTHKKRNDSLDTRAVFIEISLVFLNLSNGPKHWGSTLRNTVNSKGDQPLAGAFHAIMDKIEADILQIAEKWSWNESSYIKDTFPEIFQL